MRQAAIPFAEDRSRIDAARAGVGEPEGNPPGEIGEHGVGGEEVAKDWVSLVLKVGVEVLVEDIFLETVPGFGGPGKVEEACSIFGRRLGTSRKAVIPRPGVV